MEGSGSGRGSGISRTKGFKAAPDLQPKGMKQKSATLTPSELAEFFQQINIYIYIYTHVCITKEIYIIRCQNHIDAVGAEPLEECSRCVCICMCICICICMCMCMYVYIYIYIHIYIHTDIDIDTPEQINALLDKVVESFC